LTSATLDTSVYIRALHFGGPAALLLGHARAGTIRIDISDPLLDETVRVLRDKFARKTRTTIESSNARSRRSRISL
jgi:predicted nucleic acid-binding protein